MYPYSLDELSAGHEFQSSTTLKESSVRHDVEPAEIIATGINIMCISFSSQQMSTLFTVTHNMHVCC